MLHISYIQVDLKSLKLFNYSYKKSTFSKIRFFSVIYIIKLRKNDDYTTKVLHQVS